MNRKEKKKENNKKPARPSSFLQAICLFFYPYYPFTVSAIASASA